MAARIPLEFGADAASARAVITAVLAKSASIPSLIELGIGFPPSPEGAMEKNIVREWMFLRAHQVALRPLPLLWWFRPEDSRKLNGRSGSPRARAGAPRSLPQAGTST